MPRFPDYVAQEGLDVPSAPQIEANTAVGKSLNSLGNTLQEAGQRWIERQRQQTDFDDQIAYQRYSLAQDQALQQAQAGMAPKATGFHDTVMAGRSQADDAFLQSVSPGNRNRYAGLLALDRDRTSLAAARMEFEGRGAYEQAAFGQSAAAMADQVRASPNLLPYALDALKAQQANQSSVLPAARDAQWLATKQALQLAGWHGRYGDNPSGQGLAALGVRLSPEDEAALPLLTDEGPVDPNVDALTPAQRQQLALQSQIDRAQKQAAARADLAELQQRLADVPFTGQLDGPAPDRQTFITAHGSDDGAQRFNDVSAFLKDAPAVTALLHQPDSAQDAALRQYAAATDADGQRFYRNATSAVARYRAERAANPVGTLGKLYPDIGQAWQALESADPATLRQNLPGLVDQTAALMDAAGVPPSERRYLSTALANNLASSSHDSDRTLAERVTPLEAVFAAVKNPDLQQAIFTQCIKAGLPPLLQSMAVALAQGDRGAADRLAEAALVDPPGGSASGSPDRPPNSAVLASPVQIGDGLDRARRTGLLFTRLIQHGLARNGGDLEAAVAKARSDLFGNRPILPGDIVLP